MFQLKDKGLESQDHYRQSDHTRVSLQNPQQKQKQYDRIYSYQDVHMDKQTEDLLLGSKRFYKKDSWAKEVVQTLINCEFESNTIELHYGPYATKINIINFQYQYQYDIEKNYVGQGQFGKIYVQDLDGQVYAIKMIKLLSQNMFSTLKTVYSEYFIALMASELKVGPKIENLFGYQIVFLKNFALFGMEFCSKFGPQNYSIQQLKPSIVILHKLHVVHRDIKPQNIMWSSTYQRYILIDFGLSLIIKQHQGEKTFNSFAGSFAYSSPEMRRLFLIKNPGQVNLFQNDLFAYQKSKKAFSFSIKLRNKVLTTFNQQQYQITLLSSLVQISRLKKCIYQGNFTQAQLLISNSQTLIKTFLLIVIKIIEDIKISSQISKNWKVIKKNLIKKLIKKKFKTSVNDEILSNMVKKNNIGIFWPQRLLSSKNFQQLLHNQMWLERLYFILNPLEKSGQKRCLNVQHSQEIINKIYKTLKLPYTQLLIKKIRAVYLFFFQKLKKFKNKIILQSISDILALLGDQLNAMKIRDYLFLIIKDPVQYCLQGFKYHLLLQFYSFFKKNVFTGYLTKIKQISIIVKLNQNDSQIINLLLKVIKRIQNLKFYQMSDFSAFLSIQNLLNELYQLVSKAKNQFIQIVQKIQYRFAFLFKHQLQYFIQNQIQNYNDNCQMKSRKKFTYLKQKLNKSQHHNCANIVISNIKFYKYALEPPLKQNIINKKNAIIQFLNYYYQVSKGLIYLLPQALIAFGFLIIDYYKDNIGTYLIQQLKQQIKWNNQSLISQQERVFQNLFWVIKLNFDNLFLIHRKKIQGSTWNQEEQKQYAQLFQVFFQDIHQKINKTIKNERQLKYLFQILKITNLMKKCYFISNSTEEQIIDQIKIILESINRENIYYLQAKTVQIKSIFFVLLVLINQLNLFKEQNKTFISNTCLCFYQQKFRFNKAIIVKTPNTFQGLIKIMYEKYGPLYTFNHIKSIILTVGGKKDFINSFKMKENMCKGINMFFKLNSSQQTRSYLINLEQKKSQNDLTQLLNNSYGCYLIFLMLLVMNDQRELLKRFQYRIALKMQKLEVYVIILILSKYFLFFVKEYKLKKRKLLNCLRKSIQYALDVDTKLNSWNKIIRIIQKKLTRWPQIIQNSINLKLARLT